MRLPRFTLLFVCVFAAAGLAACSSGGGGSQGNRLAPKEGDVFLDAFDQIGSLPFTSSVALATVPQVAAASITSGSSTQGLRYVDGTTAGLYGGSGSQQLCDATTAVNLLLDDNDKAQAWVDALNEDQELSWTGGAKLSVEDITTYVGELTSLVLQTDTRVTNHAYGNGASKAIQSVLQRGTAVMVDARGVPRARCASFSPLTGARPAASPKYVGTKWDGFDPHKLVAITAGHRVTTFRVVDVHTHKQITIVPGAACLCDRTQPTTTSTSEPEVTTTTSKSNVTTTTKPKAVTTTTHVTTTTVPSATTTTETPATTTTAP